MSSITDTMRGMSKANAGVLLVIAMLFIMGFIVFALRSSTTSFTPLYTGLSLEDSSKIIAELEKTNTPYELLSNGSIISVPSERVLRMRMSLAQQNLPSGGSVVGYEIFDKSESFGSSNAVFSINVLRALEGELSRTIASLANVETARVHLVMPKHELFSRSENKPSASVTIKMRGGQVLERSEVSAITHLISSAVPGLAVSRVTVVDGHGKLLARGDGDSSSVSANNAEEFRTNYENRTQHAVEELLEKVIGTGKVRVQVAADINFDRLVTNSEKFDPEGQVVRSVQSNSEKENAQEKNAKDNVSVNTNLPPSAASADNGGSTRSNDRADETTNFEISKTTQNLITEGGRINKISVAVLVDGTYGEDEKSYAPRKEEELKQLKKLVESAIGYDEKRGDKVEVVNMQFTNDSFKVADESIFERFKLEAQSIIQTLIVAIVAILAILLVLRPAVNQLIKQSQAATQRLGGELAALGNAAAGGVASLTGGGGGGVPSIGATLGGDSDENDSLINVSNIKGGMKSSSMRKVNEIVDKYPEETMNVLRNWISK